MEEAREDAVLVAGAALGVRVGPGKLSIDEVLDAELIQVNLEQ